jgi:DNA-binding transcriptional LysR family regulator
MEIRLLRTFKAVADSGSFTRAASLIHLTQAAVSVHVRQLEEEIGAPLFLRVNKKLYLTEEGRALLSRAETILREHDEAKAEMAAMSGASHGRFRIGVASTSVTVKPLPEILGELKRQFSVLQLTVAGGTSEWIVEQILEGNIDAGLVSLPVEENDIATEILRSDKLVGVVDRQHKLGRSREITAADLAGAPLILGEKGGNTRRLIDLFFEKANLEPKIVMELQRTEAILKMVQLGFGATILPQGAVRADVARGLLRTVPVCDLNLKWEFGAASLKSNYTTPALDFFLKLCRAYIREAED